MTQARDLADGKFDTNTLVVDAANNRVGINTASPDNEIDVRAAGNSRIKVKNTSVTGETQFHHDGNGDLNLVNTSNRHLRFFTNNTECGRFLSGGGLTFNGDTASANALDDYEEGTYTPTDRSGQSLSLTVSYASYTKVGRLVQVEFDITYPTTSNTENARISLPTTGDSTYFSGIVGWSNAGTNVKIHGANSGNVYFMDGGNPSSGNIHLSNADLSAKRLIGAFYYY